MSRKLQPQLGSIKFKRLRLWADDLRSILKGWYFQMAPPRAGLGQKSPPCCLAEFTTAIKWRPELQENNLKRINNMILCCSLIDGLILKPGKIFSFGKVVGEPTLKRGFLPGPMILRGRLGLTVGGGLCQISTTLFNAALLANMEILEKHNHSVDLWGEQRFIGLGRDAISVFGRRDLKFRNPHPQDLWVKIAVDQAALVVTCKIFGTKPLNYKVRVESQILQQIDPEAAPPNIIAKAKPITGWVVQTTRLIEQNSQTTVTYRKVEVYQSGWHQPAEGGMLVED